jgi:hypothetical protein
MADDSAEDIDHLGRADRSCHVNSQRL